MAAVVSDVRCWQQSRKHLLSASISPFDPERTSGFHAQGGSATIWASIFRHQFGRLYWTVHCRMRPAVTIEALMRVCLILTTLLATLLAFVTRAYAGTFIEFESGGSESKPVQLIGYLARPEGSGTFPAVVVLHGCGGFHEDMLAWADRLRRWGYAALAVDSFGPRAIESNCGAFSYQLTDAFRALAYLKAQPFVRSDHVAVLGFSMGGNSVLAALEQTSVSDAPPDKFRAGVALYPKCSSSTGIMTAPTLVLVGALDDWTPLRSARPWSQGGAKSASHGRPVIVRRCN